jgi:hypothetical protein
MKVKMQNIICKIRILVKPVELRHPNSASGSQEIEDFLGVAMQSQQHGVLFVRFAHSRGLIYGEEFLVSFRRDARK